MRSIPPQQQHEQQAARQRMLQFIEALPLHTPRFIFQRLGELGYVGQDEGRRALALLAHRHVRRLRYLHLDGVPRENLPPKENHLLVGPTGCGKTFLVELLFNEILELPTAHVDVTTFSETGYVGNDVSTILTRLLYAAGGDVLVSQLGVICIDEFDKLSSGSNRAVFSGAGTTKDVTGLGVQRELLKLLERGEFPVPTTFEHSTFQQRLLMRTDDIVFIACGTFSGLKSVSMERRGANRLGFGASPGPGRETIAVRYDPDELEDTATFQRYGFLPELMGRFTRIIPFAPLDAATLRQILERQVIVHRRQEMRLAGMDLEVEDAVLEHLAGRALKKETGARGLGSALTRHLEEAMFQAYSDEGVRRVRLRMEGGQVRAEVA